MLQPDAPRERALEVFEVRDRKTFDALEAEWNALVARANDEVFYRHEFLRLWIDHFAPGVQLRILIARDDNHTLRAALPLMEERTSMLGLPLRQLSATANAHSCRFDLIADDPASASDALLAHLRADDSWHVLRMGDVPAGGQAWTLIERARMAGLPVARAASVQSPYVPLPADFEALQRQLDSKFRANLRRRQKRLEEKGRITVERVTTPAALDARLEEGFALEQSGWKGHRGTAIAQSQATRGFYTELARHAARQGQLALYFLRLDGRPIAFHFALVHRDRYLLLKPAYDEQARECSPGQLLMDHVLRECIAGRLTEFDFLGPDMIWKRDWTDRVRPHASLFVFRDSLLGRALCTARFDWGPRAKRGLMRWARRAAGGET